MAETANKHRKSRRALWIVGPVLGLLVLLILAYLRPLASRKIDILTGPADSSYQALDKAFAAANECPLSGAAASGRRETRAARWGI